MYARKAVFLGALVFVIGPILGKAPAGQTPQMLTGCLVRGDAASEYKITTTDGADWSLTSVKKIKLSHYLNHLVTVNGNAIEVVKTKSGDPKDAKKSPGNVFKISDISDITVVRATCPK